MVIVAPPESPILHSALIQMVPMCAHVFQRGRGHDLNEYVTYHSFHVIFKFKKTWSDEPQQVNIVTA